jgi:isoquinoline 1-oxidoreductase alpha subunit
VGRVTINGKERVVRSADDTPLLWVLREELGLTGTRYGCGAGMCGACTVHVDGDATRSCVMPVAAAYGREVVTIEGLAKGGNLSAVQQAWLDEDVVQCGYCQSGMIMSVAALIARTPTMSEEELMASLTNLCRCGTYPRIKRAILRALGR